MVAALLVVAMFVSSCRACPTMTLPGIESNDERLDNIGGVKSKLGTRDSIHVQMAAKDIQVRGGRRVGTPTANH